MKSVLIDFGSSFIKYSFYDSETRENTEVFSLPFPKPAIDGNGLYEVDHNMIEQVLMSIIKEAEARNCTAAFLCVQMHGYLLKYRGEFSNYISWKDTRGRAYLEDVACKDLFENGTVIKKNLPRVSLKTYPSLAEKEFFTLGSYIAYLLTGNNITHITDACASGLFKIDACTFDTVFEGLSGPMAVDEIKPCGRYKNMAIYPPMGDHQVSFLGVNALKGELVLNLGTAAQLTFLTDDTVERIRGVEYRPYFIKGKRVATLSGFFSANEDALISAVKSHIGTFKNVKTIFISGGATEKYGCFASELQALGYKVEKCRKNAGNEGLKRIADCVFFRRGTMLSEIEFVNFPYIFKKAGLDFFIIDSEHGCFENKTVNALAMNARQCDVQAIVRIPNNGREMITKLADGGVFGFMLPMTNSKEDIEKVIEYAKYSPLGKRGISTTRAHTEYGVANVIEYMGQANKRMKIYVQIETREGVRNLEKILTVPGLEGIFIGPNDLSCDYGCMGENERIKALVSVITQKCVEKNKPCGIITTDKELIAHALLCGCSMVSYGSELNILKKGASEIRNEKYL